MALTGIERKIKNSFFSALKLVAKPKKISSKDLKSADKSKILVIKHDRIGDMLLATPLFSALKRNLPSSYISVLASNYNKVVLENNPYIDEVLVYDFKSSRRSSLKNLNAGFLKKLRNKKYDIVLVTNASSTSAFLSYLCGGKLRVGMKIEGKQKHISDLFFNYEVETEGIGLHAVEKNLRFAEAMGINTKKTDTKLELFLSEKEKGYSKKFYEKNDIKENDLVIGIHPSVDKPECRWNAGNFAALADSLKNKYNAKVIVIYGPNEKGIIEKFDKITEGRHIITPPTSVREMISIISGFDMFIGNDTSTAHIASAFDEKVIDIFGPTDPAEYRPWCANYRVLAGKNGNTDNVRLDQVLKAAEELLNI